MKNLGTIAGAAAFVAAMSFAGTASATEIWALTGMNLDNDFRCDATPELVYNGGNGTQAGTVGNLVIGTHDGTDLSGHMRTGNNRGTDYSNSRGANLLQSCESATIEYNLPVNGTELGYANCTATWMRAGGEISMMKHDDSTLNIPSATIQSAEGVWLNPAATVGDTGFVLIASNPHTVQLIADDPGTGDGVFSHVDDSSGPSTDGRVSLDCVSPLIAVASSAGGTADKGGRNKGNSPQRVYSGSVGLTTEAVAEGELIVHYWNTDVGGGGGAEDFKCTWTPSVVFYDAGPQEKATVEGDYVCTDEATTEGGGTVVLTDGAGGSNKGNNKDRGNVTVDVGVVGLDTNDDLETGNVHVTAL